MLFKPRQKWCALCYRKERALRASENRARKKQKKLPAPPEVSVLDVVRKDVRYLAKSLSKDVLSKIDAIHQSTQLTFELVNGKSFYARSRQHQLVESEREAAAQDRSRGGEASSTKALQRGAKHGGSRGQSFVHGSASNAHQAAAQGQREGGASSASAMSPGGSGAVARNSHRQEVAAPPEFPAEDLQLSFSTKYVAFVPARDHTLYDRKDAGSGHRVTVTVVGPVRGGDARFACKTYFNPAIAGAEGAAARRPVRSDRLRAAYEAYIINKHSGSASLYYAVDDKGETSVVVMPLIAGIDLRGLFEKPPGKKKKNWSVASVAVAFLHALERLHTKGVVHGDVHPANCLYDVETGTAELVDLNLAFEYKVYDINPYNSNGFTGKAGYQFRV